MIREEDKKTGQLNVSSFLLIIILFVCRFFRQTTGLFNVEIDPGDGSVMRSQTASGRYFNHWFVQQNQQQVQTHVQQ